MKRRLKVTLGPGATIATTAPYYINVGSDATFRIEGEFDVEIEDLDNFVQVKTWQYERLTYRDPSGQLQIGDRVIVPLGWHNSDALATVIALGRGTYEGYTKDVKSFLSEVPIQEIA